MRIDASVGLCYRAQFHYDWQPHRDYTAEDLAPILARNRFDGAIVSALGANPAETDWLLSLAGREPWIGGVLARSGGPADLDRWQAHPKFLGMRLDGREQARELARRGLVACVPSSAARAALDADPGLRLAVSAPHGADVSGLRDSTALIQIDSLLQSHSAGGWRAEYFRPWVQQVLAEFGVDRIAFGSGWPRSMPAATWKECLACFTQCIGAHAIEARERLLGENARDFYRPVLPGVGYTEESFG